jgi:hypothetical protein
MGNSPKVLPSGKDGAVQDGDPVGHGLNKMSENIGGSLAQGLAMKRNEGELARAINGHEEIKPALGGPYLGDVDLEEAVG